ncbi:MAG TPA: DMT family transporter, partial [Bdellovibrionota bacterium]|nr:DMT family transporter [Bdellovibrionota bacterium]
MAWLSFFALTLFWGCSFIAIRFAVEAIPPFAAAGMRIFIATLIMGLLAVVQRIRGPKSWREVFLLAFLGVLNFGVPWACLFWGEQYVVPALASILNSTVPIFVLLFSWALLPDEQPNVLKVIGVGLGFGGILLVFAPALDLNPADRNNLYGMLSVVTMAVSYAMGGVLIRRHAQHIDIRWSIAVQGACASAMLFLLSFVSESGDWISSATERAQALWGVLYLAIFSTAIAWFLFLSLIREWGPLRAAAVTYTLPFVAIVIDWFYYGKWPSANQLVGAGLIISGVVLIHVARSRD